MTNSDLNDLSLTKLKKLQRDIARTIESFDNRQKQAAWTQTSSATPTARRA